MKKYFIVLILSLLLLYGCNNTKQLTTKVPLNTTEYPKTFEEAEQWFDSIHSRFPIDTLKFRSGGRI